MNILIDYLASNVGGGRTVAKEQLTALLRNDKENIYYVLMKKGNTELETISATNLKKLTVNYGNIIERVKYQFVDIYKLINRYKIELLFCPNNFLTIYSSKINKITMYQNSLLFYGAYLEGDLFTKVKMKLNIILTKVSIYKSNVNVFVSNYIKNGRKGLVVYLGKENNQKVMSEKRVKYDVCTITSNLSKYKNIDMLIKAMKENSKNYNKKFKLIIIGGDSSEKIEAIMRKRLNKIPDLDIKITGLVEHKKVIEYINESRLFVSASLIEAFPLTQFECIENDIPVLLSDIEIHKELCGKADIYFKRLDYLDLANRIENIFENYETYKNSLNEIKNHSQSFTWDNHALKLIEIFNTMNNK